MKAQGSVWALLIRAEFSPVTWPQEYPVTESFSHLITQLWLQQGCKAEVHFRAGYFVFVFSVNWGVLGTDWVLTALLPLQFAVLMWVFTYVGALFNGLTLLILGKCLTCLTHLAHQITLAKHWEADPVALG